MRFCVVGCSHRTAPLELRERLAWPPEQIPQVLDRLRALPEVAEALVVSTCNRVEIYAVTPDAERAEEALKAFLAASRSVTLDELDPVLYCWWDSEAVKHIFRVTASLDAMVVGEAQIMGQIKRAYMEAESSETVGSLLTRCMHRAFSIAKRVRSETDISRHPASLSSVAVDLAGRIFEDISAVSVLVVGAGEMAQLAVTHLVSDGATRIHVANRSAERAEELARRLGGRAVPMEELAEQLEWADVVITSTGSQQPIIDKALLAEVMRRRKQRQLLVVDIAVPRDVDHQARSLANLYLFDVDDLQEVVSANLQARRREAKAAEKMVAAEVDSFDEWLRSRDVVPLIKQMRAHFSEVARSEAQRVARKMSLDGPEQREMLDRLAHAIVNKLLHAPTTQLKKVASGGGGGADLTEAARQLFGFEEPGDREDQEEQAAADGAIARDGTALGNADREPALGDINAHRPLGPAGGRT